VVSSDLGEAGEAVKFPGCGGENDSVVKWYSLSMSVTDALRSGLFTRRERGAPVAKTVLSVTVFAHASRRLEDLCASVERAPEYPLNFTCRNEKPCSRGEPRAS